MGLFLHNRSFSLASSPESNFICQPSNTNADHNCFLSGFCCNARGLVTFNVKLIGQILSSVPKSLFSICTISRSNSAGIWGHSPSFGAVVFILVYSSPDHHPFPERFELFIARTACTKRTLRLEMKIKQHFEFFFRTKRYVSLEFNYINFVVLFFSF